jgi:hypothetical protein
VYIKKITSLGTKVVHTEHSSSYVPVSPAAHKLSLNSFVIVTNRGLCLLSLDWIHLARDRDQCRAFMKSAIKLRDL